MSKSYYHNKGEKDRSNSTGGKGHDYYKPPHSVLGEILFGKRAAKENKDYNDGWGNHRKQKGR